MHFGLVVYIIINNIVRRIFVSHSIHGVSTKKSPALILFGLNNNYHQNEL